MYEVCITNLLPLVPVLGLDVVRVVDLRGRVDGRREVFQQRTCVHFFVVQQHAVRVVRTHDQRVQVRLFVLVDVFQTFPAIDCPVNHHHHRTMCDKGTLIPLCGVSTTCFFFHSRLSLIIAMLTPFIFMSCFTQSIHLFLCRHLLGCPSTFIAITLFVM
jgi:hypothetical protein